ncbi:MAG TPA: hypothetical protein VLZ74_15250 [Methylocella sp.]|nr:hypothetical protein [Methylocella sp.]
MVIYRSLVKAAAVVSALVPACSLFFPVAAFAKPTRLECTLTSAGADGKEMSRKISVVFDAGANTLDFYQGSQHSELAKVTISTISIDGYTDDMSIGIDRSSWSIVVQTYSQDHVLAEFGICKPHS